jgi:hypothetical protein
MKRAPSPVVPLASLRCDDCGAADVIAVHPGMPEEQLLGTLLIARGDRLRAWCLACAMRYGWLEAAA